jgi:hypothetical protein
MKTGDKNIEHILKGLADFRPPAKPDWESFYDKNKMDIEASSGSMAKSGHRKLTSSVWPRNTLIGLGFIIGIFAGFYFLSSDSSDLQIEENSPNISNNNNVENAVPVGTITTNEENFFAGGPTKDTEVTERKPETSNGPVLNIENTGTREEGEIRDAETGTDINTTGEPKPVHIVQQETAGTDVKPVDEKPVIIKKTVIIKDTIRVTRPGKK